MEKNNNKINEFVRKFWGCASPELCLLLACLRRALRPQAAAASLGPVREPINWDAFLSLVDHNRLAPVIYPISRVWLSQGLPREISEKLRQRFADNSKRGLGLSAELIRLFQAMEPQGVTLFPLKGPLLALQLHGDPGRRHAGDLDVLVDSSQVEKAWKILEELGYLPEPWERRLTTTQLGQFKVLRNNASFHKPSHHLTVELHWRLIHDRYFMRENDRRWFGPQFSRCRFFGQLSPCLPPDRLLLYLCAHGSVHFWRRLFWLYDVVRLLQDSPGLDWSRLIRQARDLGCLRSLLLGTACCHILLDFPAPGELQEQWRQDPALLTLLGFSYPFFDHSQPGFKNVFQTIRFHVYLSKLRGSLAKSLPYFVNKLFLPSYEMSYTPVPLLPIYFLLKPLLWARDKERRKVPLWGYE